MDDRQPKIITMSDGQQVYIEETPTIKIAVESDTTSVQSEQQINITDKQRKQLMKNIGKREICYDENSGELTFTPKKAR